MRRPEALARELIRAACDAPDPRPLLEAARALLATTADRAPATIARREGRA